MEIFEIVAGIGFRLCRIRREQIEDLVGKAYIDLARHRLPFLLEARDEVFLRHEQLVIFESEKVTQPPVVMAGGHTQAIQILVELLSVEIEFSTNSRDGFEMIATISKILAVRRVR